MVDEEGFFRITDRMKDIIITAGGKNITPSEFENELKFSPYITDAVVIGDKRPYLTVIVMIDQENVEKFAQDHDVPFSNYASLTRAPEVQDADPGRDRPRQHEVRAGRADQEVLPARHAADRRGRGAHADDEAQAQAGADRSTPRRSRRCTADHMSRPVHRQPQGDTRMKLKTLYPPLAEPRAVSRLAAGLPRAQRRASARTRSVIGTIQDLSGPLAGFGKQARNGMQLRVDETQRAGQHPRPQAQAAGRGLRLRPEEGGAGGAEAGQPGQDLHHGRPHRHGAEHGGDAGAVREERRQLLADHRGARDVRAVPQAQVLASPPPTTTRCATALPKLVKEKNAKKVCTIYQDDDFGLEVHARRRGRPEDHRHGAGREDHATSAAPPTSPRRSRR